MILRPLPAGVAIPPIAAAIGIPNIKALPKFDFPGRQPFFCRRGYAILEKITAVGMSASTLEIIAVGNIKLSRTLSVFCPKIALTINETRFPSPVLMKVMAIINADKIKKRVVVAKFAMASFIGKTFSISIIIKNRAAEIPIGMTSKTQTITTATIKARAFWPWGGKFAGVGKFVSIM
ncbi:hypothetical protein MTHERMOG20_23960 [Moorella thermoacetica]|nr:hypothetical protein MTHERMOG20_23960 [Moorella thermoacetica]